MHPSRDPAQGEVEELFFLGRPVDAEQVRFYYGGTWKQAFLGPVGTREEEKAKEELLTFGVEMLAFESGTVMSLDEGEIPARQKTPSSIRKAAFTSQSRAITSPI